HQVLEVDGSPTGPGAVDRAADGATPRLRVAGAAARVGVEHGVAGAGVHLELVEEAGSVLREGAAVDRQQDRVALPLLEARRAHEPRIHLGAVPRGGREPLRLDELAAFGER